MKRKMIYGSVLAVFILVSISMVSVVGMGIFDRGERYSPLYGLRLAVSIGDREEDGILSDYLEKGVNDLSIRVNGDPPSDISKDPDTILDLECLDYVQIPTVHGPGDMCIGILTSAPWFCPTAWMC